MRVLLAIACLALLTGAKAPRYEASWVFVPVSNSPNPVTFQKNKNIKIGRVVPTRLFKLSGDAVVANGPISYLSKGTLMVPVDGNMRKFCRLERHEGSAFGCLHDEDGDGRFDGYFGTQVFKEFFTGSVGDDGGHQPLTAPVSYVEVDSVAESPNIDLEFIYVGLRNRTEIIQRVCLSKKINDNRTFYQSQSKKGFSVLCSGYFLKKAAASFGFGVNVHERNKNTLIATIVPTGQSFHTTSNYR